MGEERIVYRVLVGKPDGNHCEDRGVYGMMKSEGILNYRLGGVD
jgi:hypothetical protein